MANLKAALLTMVAGYLLFEVCGAYNHNYMLAAGKDDLTLTFLSMLGLTITWIAMMLVWREAKHAEKRGTGKDRLEVFSVHVLARGN